MLLLLLMSLLFRLLGQHGGPLRLIQFLFNLGSFTILFHNYYIQLKKKHLMRQFWEAFLCLLSIRLFFSNRTCETYSSSLWFRFLARWRLRCLRWFGRQCFSFGCWFSRLPVMCANCEIHRTEMVSCMLRNTWYHECFAIPFKLTSTARD